MAKIEDRRIYAPPFFFAHSNCRGCVVVKRMVCRRAVRGPISILVCVPVDGGGVAKDRGGASVRPLKTGTAASYLRGPTRACRAFGEPRALGG